MVKKRIIEGSDTRPPGERVKKRETKKYAVKRLQAELAFNLRHRKFLTEELKDEQLLVLADLLRAELEKVRREMFRIEEELMKLGIEVEIEPMEEVEEGGGDDSEGEDDDGLPPEL